MQNYYAVERFIREHDEHALALAELQAMRRQATADRRWGLGVVTALRSWLRSVSVRHPAPETLALERVRKT